MQEPPIKRDEWREGNGVHYKEYTVIDKPNGVAFLGEGLDFRDTIVEKACEIFNGKIVLIVDKDGEVIFKR